MKKISCLMFFAISLAISPAVSALGQDVERMFSRLDRNGDGLVENDEIPENLRPRMMNLDKNADGKISQEEFKAGRAERSPSRNPEARDARRPQSNPNQPQRPNVNRFQQLLQRVDKNNNGSLEFSELPEAMQQRLARFDSTQDQAIDAKEFAAVMQERAIRPTNPLDPNRRRPAAESQRLPSGNARSEGMARFQNMLKNLPRNENGDIDLAAIQEEGIQKRLSQFDANGNQVLEGPELRAVAQKFRERASQQPNPNSKPGDRSMNRKNERKPDRGGDRAPQRPKRPSNPDKE